MDLTEIITNFVIKERPEFDGKSLYIHEIKLLNNQQHNQIYKNKQLLLPITNEKLLFHGAPFRNIDNIIINNFNLEKVSKGMDGHIGQGIYFSDMIEQSSW